MDNNLNLFMDISDVIILTETRLTNEIEDSELNLKNYIIYRQDRRTSSALKKGGGCLIAIKKGLISTRIDDFSPCGIKIEDVRAEFLFVRIKLQNTNLIIGALYMPPFALPDDYEKFCLILESINKENISSSLIVCGDFNLSYIVWENNDDLLTFYSFNNKAEAKDVLAANIIKNHFSELGITHQHHPIHPVKGYSLDLAFSTSTEFGFLHDIDAIVPWDKEHHFSSTFEFRSPGNNINNSKNLYHISRYNFNKVNSTLLNHLIFSINWIEFLDFNTLNLDECIELFYRLLYELIDIVVPKYIFKCNNFPTWFSKNLIETIIDKKIAHFNWKNTGDIRYQIEFKRLRALSILLSRKNYQEYIHNIENSIGRNSKTFWNYVNECRNYKNIPSVMKHNNFVFDNDLEICNAFADFFSSVYKVSNNNSHRHVFNNNSILDSIVLHVSDIELAIRALRPVGPGPDGIPPKFIKTCSSSIALPLYIIFNQSLKIGKFPEKWKQSYITPVFKSGDRKNISNYRPICAINAFAKLFESAVYEKFYLSTEHLISKNQHGFVKKKSIITNLLNYSSKVTESLNSGAQVDVIYYDFAKAFDCVDHNILINRLSKIGISGSFLNWIESYLQNRLQTVRIRDTLSYSFLATSGVPQGSKLGPLLFILFINDVTTCVRSSQLDLFADDLRMYKTIHSLADCQSIQSDIDNIYKWSIENNIDLNIKKCSVMTVGKGLLLYEHDYCINDTTLERIYEVRDLGIIFDSAWTFDKHIDFAVSKAFKLIGFIKRTTFKFRSYKAIVGLYKSLVLPQLLYGSIIWSPHHKEKFDKLEAIPRKLLRYASSKTNNPMSFLNHDFSEISRKCGIYTIKSHHKANDLIFVNNILIKSCLLPNVLDIFKNKNLSYDLRFYRPLLENKCTQDLVFFSPVFRLRRTWNNFCTQLKISEITESYKEIIKKNSYEYL